MKDLIKVKQKPRFNHFDDYKATAKVNKTRESFKSAQVLLLRFSEINIYCILHELFIISVK